MTASAGTDSLFGRIGEYFTLSAARAAQAKLGEPARKAMDQALSLGRQRADAAESLWSNGHTAEALRLAVRALEDTLGAAPAYAKAMGVSAAKAAEPAARKAEPAPKNVVAKVDGEKAETERSADADEPKSADEAEAKADAEAKDEGEGEKAEAEAKPEGEKGEGDAKPEVAKAEGEDADAAEAEKPEGAEAAAEPSAEPEAPKAEPAVDADDWSGALTARGASTAHLDKIRAALGAIKKTTLPTLDAEVSAAHADLFQQVLDARHLVDRSFGMVALPPRDLGWTRFSRIATASVIGVLVLGGLYFGLRTPEGVFADASDVWAQSPTFAPEHVLDGNEDSYWLLPDGATGWVEARISPAVDVHRIRLLNTHNPPHNDRATRDYAVEIYSGGELAQTIEGSFEFSANPEFVTHDVSVSHVDRIRFVARSHHHVGAGLAELQWE